MAKQKRMKTEESKIETQKQQLDIPVSVSVLEQIRQAFADYRYAEGCSCCRDIEKHEEAEKRLAELLNPTPYDDGSGFDWSQYRTER